jgi:hypothetical protein
LNTWFDEGGDKIVVGVGVMVEEEGRGLLSSGMLNVMVSTSLSKSARLRLGMMVVLQNRANGTGK